MLRFLQGIEYSNQFNYTSVLHYLQVPTVSAATSAYSECCYQCLQCVLPPVLGFGFRAPASASTFSEISSNSYKVTGFQKKTL